MKKIIIITTCIVLIGAGCKILAYKKYAENMSVSFGSGGGFTGAVDEFILDGKGALKSIKPFGKDTVLLKTIAAKDIKVIFKKLESKEMAEITLNKPGNMTNFIKFTKSGQTIKNYQWAQGSEVPKEITELFNMLNKHITP